MSNSRSVNGALFTRYLAIQRYKVGPYAMDIHGVRFCYAIGVYASTLRLDARFLHNQMSNSRSVNGLLFTGYLATQRYKVRPYTIDIHGVRFCYETSIYAGACRPDARFLHNQTSNSDSVNGTIFSPFPAFQQY